jgi:hypothetical protein
MIALALALAVSFTASVPAAFGLLTLCIRLADRRTAR